MSLSPGSTTRRSSRKAASDADANGSNKIGWTILSNHGHVVVCIATAPDLTLREIAERVGITERAVFGIVTDLERAGYLTRRREGRRSTYELHLDMPLRHPLESRHTLGDLLAALKRSRTSGRRPRNGTQQGAGTKPPSTASMAAAAASTRRSP